MTESLICQLHNSGKRPLKPWVISAGRLIVQELVIDMLTPSIGRHQLG